LKHAIDDLAYFGGVPAFSEPLHVGRPNIGSRERLLARINDILDRRWLTNNGKYVREFEDRLSQLMGVRHCIAMCNGTVALEIATRALDFSGEVIVPSFTFVATAHALQWQEITPVFCDISHDSYTIDPDRIEEMITPKTTGIIGVHIWGRACDVDTLAEIARRRRLKLVFDAAHALGCTYKGRMIGSFGDAEVFSFHATKFFNSFEGGAVATNNDDLAAKIRLMKNFGFSGLDNVIHIGTNGKMNEISAAMGLSSLEDMDRFIEINLRNYRIYRRNLEGIPGIILLPYDSTEKSNYQYVVVEVEENASILGRDKIVELLHAENVIARRYFYPGCHRMEPYRSYFPHAGVLLPNTEGKVLKVISLPTGTAIEAEDIKKICSLIRFFVENSNRIGPRL
jgi:dTDP-4-amino-4,6-dideoxygalactose transaminase